jgi:hypothetical protein
MLTYMLERDNCQTTVCEGTAAQRPACVDTWIEVVRPRGRYEGVHYAEVAVSRRCASAANLDAPQTKSGLNSYGKPPNAMNQVGSGDAIVFVAHKQTTRAACRGSNGGHTSRSHLPRRNVHY